MDPGSGVTERGDEDRAGLFVPGLIEGANGLGADGGMGIGLCDLSESLDIGGLAAFGSSLQACDTRAALVGEDRVFQRGDVLRETPGRDKAPDAGTAGGTHERTEQQNRDELTGEARHAFPSCTTRDGLNRAAKRLDGAGRPVGQLVWRDPLGTWDRVTQKPGGQLREPRRVVRHPAPQRSFQTPGSAEKVRNGEATGDILRTVVGRVNDGDLPTAEPRQRRLDELTQNRVVRAAKNQHIRLGFRSRREILLDGQAGPVVERRIGWLHTFEWLVARLGVRRALASLKGGAALAILDSTTARLALCRNFMPLVLAWQPGVVSFASEAGFFPGIGEPLRSFQLWELPPFTGIELSAEGFSSPFAWGDVSEPSNAPWRPYPPLSWSDR